MGIALALVGLYALSMPHYGEAANNYVGLVDTGLGLAEIPYSGKIYNWPRPPVHCWTCHPCSQPGCSPPRPPISEWPEWPPLQPSWPPLDPGWPPQQPNWPPPPPPNWPPPPPPNWPPPPPPNWPPPPPPNWPPPPVQQPPIMIPQPPIMVPQPPITVPQPPIAVPQPPITVPQPPIMPPRPPPCFPCGGCVCQPPSGCWHGMCPSRKSQTNSQLGSGDSVRSSNGLSTESKKSTKKL